MPLPGSERFQTGRRHHALKPTVVAVVRRAVGIARVKEAAIVNDHDAAGDRRQVELNGVEGLAEFVKRFARFKRLAFGQVAVERGVGERVFVIAGQHRQVAELAAIRWQARSDQQRRPKRELGPPQRLDDVGREQLAGVANIGAQGLRLALRVAPQMEENQRIDNPLGPAGARALDGSSCLECGQPPPRTSF